MLGAPPVAVVIFEVIFGIANVLEHGNFDLPRRFEEALSVALVTPALHRRHHSTERSERDSNFGTILCLWDRLAQTLTPSTSAAVFPTGLPGRTGAGRSLAGRDAVRPDPVEGESHVGIAAHGVAPSPRRGRRAATRWRVASTPYEVGYVPLPGVAGRGLSSPSRFAATSGGKEPSVQTSGDLPIEWRVERIATNPACARSPSVSSTERSA